MTSQLSQRTRADRWTPPGPDGGRGRHREPRSERRTTTPVRTPIVLQMEAVECGAAALAMVLAHHGRHVSLEELRLACGVSRDGANALMVMKAAQRYGLLATGMQIEADELPTLRPPTILFWEFNHFVVWEGTGRHFGRRAIFLNDPATGRRTVTPDEFDESFTGVALTFEPGPTFRRGGRRTRALADVPRRLRDTRTALLIAVVASLLLVGVGLAEPAFLLAFVDMFQRQAGGATDSVPVLLFGFMAVLVGIGAVLTAVQQRHLARMQIVMSTLSHARFLRHLLRLPLSFFTQRSQADLTTRLSSNGIVAEILARDVVAVIINAVIITGYAAVLWTYDPLLALLGVGIATLNIVALRLVTRLRESGVARLRKDRAKLYTASFEGIHLIETMKATGGEQSYFRRWAGLQATVLAGQQRVGAPSAVFTTVAPALAGLSSAVILLVGGLRAVDGILSVGLLVVFQSLLFEFTRPIGELSAVASRVQDFGAEVARLRDVEAFAVDPVYARPEPDRIRRLEGYLEFVDVTFGYSPTAPPLLTGFSLRAAPGQQIALVGGSGSGKSTVSRLISGLYSPWEGEVRFDGENRETIPRSVLAASVGFVDQDIYLFDGTVRDNIALRDPSISDEDVTSALRDAAVHDIVAARPDGIHTRVEEGGRNFSGGQRQRLEIARAIVRYPSVLVLDEATSALDAETERQVIANLRRRGCACVVIAHRLSTVRDSDEIIVLDRGAVVERGRHEHLLTAGGAYADLVRDQ
jgi:NHLM bacteriocin system ABC transporter peptidase/ATP-binding protein